MAAISTEKIRKNEKALPTAARNRNPLDWSAILCVWPSIAGQMCVGGTRLPSPKKPRWHLLTGRARAQSGPNMYALFSRTTATRSDMASSDTSKSKNSLQEACEDFIEKVSVAGWKEAFEEHIAWIAHCYKISLLVLSGFCFFYIGMLIDDKLHSGYTDEITDIPNSVTMPMSNVTICAQVYFNETYVRETVIIPRHIEDLVLGRPDGKKALDEFYRQLTLFLTMTTRPRIFDPAYLAYFLKVLHANPQIDDYANFATAATPSCQQMIKKCWFDGIEFDCCERAVRLFYDDGVCYVIAVSSNFALCAQDKRVQSSLKHRYT